MQFVHPDAKDLQDARAEHIFKRFKKLCEQGMEEKHALLALCDSLGEKYHTEGYRVGYSTGYRDAYSDGRVDRDRELLQSAQSQFPQMFSQHGHPKEGDAEEEERSEDSEIYPGYL